MSLDDQLLDYTIEHLFSYTIGIATLESVGFCPEGLRTNAYATGGEVTGPRVHGKVRPVGGNWPVLRSDGVALIDYGLMLETEDGGLIYLTCAGVSDFGEDAYQRGAGSGERGAGSGERGAGSGEQGAGSGERGAGSGERGAGSGEQGAGSREREP